MRLVRFIKHVIFSRGVDQGTFFVNGGGINFLDIPGAERVTAGVCWS